MRQPTLCLLTAVLMLSASACTTKPVAVKPPALDLACDSGAIQCSGDCQDLPLWSADQDGKGDFDALIGLGGSDRLVLETCKAKLKACQLCLNRGRDAEVIR